LATRIVFIVIALAIVGGFVWAYRHDAELGKRARMIEVGDPNEAVRELLGEPSSQGSCGSMSVAPSGCTVEYVYRYYYTVFQPEFEVVWFNAEGKVIASQHIRRPF
jgi:hypothetical protein